MFSFIIYVVYVYFIISYFIKLNVLNHDLSKTSRVAENTKTITFLGKYCLLNPMSRLPPKQVQIASTAFNVGRLTPSHKPIQIITSSIDSCFY